MNSLRFLKEGFLIGGGLIFAGLMLELSVGPVRWDAFAWPANGIVLAGFLAIIALISLLRKKVYTFQFIGTYQAAIPAMVYAVVLTIIMGLTRQQVNGTWLNNCHPQRAKNSRNRIVCSFCYFFLLNNKFTLRPGIYR